MIRTLHLIRHASAGEANSDFERPLTANGQRDATHLGYWILENYPEIDWVITSKAKRAISTAKNICEVLKINKLHADQDLYEAPIRIMLQKINELKNDHLKVILVGHNPTISYCADYLSASPAVSMEPGSMITLDFEDLDWNEISKGSGVFKEYINNRTYN